MQTLPDKRHGTLESENQERYHAENQYDDGARNANFDVKPVADMVAMCAAQKHDIRVSAENKSEENGNPDEKESAINKGFAQVKQFHAHQSETGEYAVKANKQGGNAEPFVHDDV